MPANHKPPQGLFGPGDNVPKPPKRTVVEEDKGPSGFDNALQFLKNSVLPASERIDAEAQRKRKNRE